MRKMLSYALVLTLPGVAASAQAPNRAAAEKTIIANETAVNEAVAKNDLAGFKKHLASDGWSVDPTGLAPITEFEKILDQVKVEPGWKVGGFKVVWISDSAAVLSYRWTGKATIMGQPYGDSHASTVWVNRNGNWVALFHQETPAAPAMPAKK